MTLPRRMAGLFAAAMLVAGGAIGSSTAARVVTNVAAANFRDGNGPVRVESNQVDVVVRNDPPPPGTSITSYRFSQAPGAIQLPVAPTACLANGGSRLLRPGGAYETVATDPASLVVSASFKAGEPVVLAITDPLANTAPDAADRLTITLTTPGGDRETIVLSETGANTALFTGMINTAPLPPAAVAGDCRLSVPVGAAIPIQVTATEGSRLTASLSITFLIDPYGLVFDSATGQPVSGARVTVVSTATGQPARAFGDDGVSQFPSSVIAGGTATDSSGVTYSFPVGEYRFPFMEPGSYRLIIEPPSPYRAPSTVPAERLAGVTRPDGSGAVDIIPASYGQAFTLIDPQPLRIDVPVDRDGTAVVLTKTASVAVAAPGDAIAYRLSVVNRDALRATGPLTVRDDLPPALRLRVGTVRYNGTAVAANVAPDGGSFSVALPPLPPGGSGVLSYLAEVRPDAVEGDAVNTARVDGAIAPVSNTADAAVRISHDVIAAKMTIIGRVIDGDCTVDPATAKGVGGVRVMAEDGSYSVTDSDGRYHFEGLRPGTHVVAIDRSTVPASHAPVLCGGGTRTAGSALSRFVEGSGGSLHRADFRVASVAGADADVTPGSPAPASAGPASIPAAAAPAPARPAPASDAAAAGGERDWFAGQTAGIDWLFPAPDHNPRTQAVRVAIKHMAGQTVRLRADGKPVDILNFEGVKQAPDGSFAVSLWRGVPISDDNTRFTAEVVDASGAVVQTLSRTVHYSGGAIRAQFIREASHLVADGVTRPVIAIRLTDYEGRPVRSGMSGEFDLSAPYYAAVEADAQQARQLSGLDRARPFWRVEGDDGMAYVELEPTTASGTAVLTFSFRDGTVERRQAVQAWLTMGDQPWTMVGFAEGTIGYRTLAANTQPLDENADSGDDLRTDARLALYARGRVLGKWVMTLGIDSDKPREEARFGGMIDPRAYYTIYADRTDRRYDAASVRRLYLKLERPQFYALFGDYETGIDEPELARYQRALNGVKAEYRGPNLAATAFAADTPYRHRRTELQGDGLTGPYPLGARDILANSERVTIEVRDRLRPEIIVSQRRLVRHIDYDIDYLQGLLRFREPILSRDSALNPQFIVADYEVDGVGTRVLNAGGRVSWTSNDERLRLGATAIHDETDLSRSALGGVDVRFRPTATTEIRAEAAVSRANRAGAAPTTTDTAWLVEAEHHGERFDALAYIRDRDGGFGVGQLSAAGNAARKIGFDGRMRIADDLSIAAAFAHEAYRATGITRRTARILADYTAERTTARAGFTFAQDTDAQGARRTSALAQLGASQRLFDNRLTLDAQTEFAIAGKNDSVDFPARHTLGARYALNDSVTLIGLYEIAKGETFEAHTARIGFDLKPWAGSRITASANNQNFAEYGPRTYAAFGLAQSWQVTDSLSLDASLDLNQTLGGFRPSDVVDPAHPPASGGFIGNGGLLAEDFVAVTAGATWRNADWSITGRGEYRDGEFADRMGFTASALRRIGDGQAIGALVNWAHAETPHGLATATLTGELSWAYRPADSRWSWLEKLELRDDRVEGAVAGQPGPIGGPPLTVDGNVRSRRIINSISLNYSPQARRGGRWFEGGEYALFWGTRYTFDRFGPDDVQGWSNVIGLDARTNLSERVDVGGSGSVRFGTGARSYAWAGGPTLGWSPATNANLVIGYNIGGFRDRDFEQSRYTRSGPYVTFRLKFDQTTLTGLGL